MPPPGVRTDDAVAVYERWQQCKLPDGTYEDTYAGLMIALGDVGGGRYLCGIDLDSCLTADGVIATWLDPYLDILQQTYIETSPSGSGAHAFFFLAADDLDQVREAFGIEPGRWGCKIAIGEDAGSHGPAVEPALAARFFTITADHWPESAPVIATFDVATLQRLAELLPTRPQRPSGEFPEGNSGGRDTTRSSTAITIANRMQRARASYDSYVKAVRNNPKTADWYREKGVVNDERELKRAWEKAGNWARPNKNTPEDDEPGAEVRLWQPARDVLPYKADGSIDEAGLPKRQWVAELLPPRGKAGLLAGSGGVGKSTIAMAIGMSVVTDRELLDLTVYGGGGGVAICLLEDTELDLVKSVLACRKWHRIPTQELRQLYLYGNRDDEQSRLIIARRDEDGSVLAQPIVELMVAQLRQDRICLLIVDALRFTHSVEENSNDEMSAVMGLWNEVARRANCVVLLLHHNNKGAGQGLERSRGATAIVDHSRGGLALACMTAAEAQALQLTDHHTSYVRLDDTKMNFQPKPTEAIWFHIVRVDLDNGDNQGVAERWYPPLPKTEPFTDELAAVVTRGLGNGEYWTKDIKSKDRWFGIKVMKLMGVDKQEANELIKRWIKSKVLKEEDYQSPMQRKLRPRLVYAA